MSNHFIAKEDGILNGLKFDFKANIANSKSNKDDKLFGN
jgi:hypothetical protein